MCGTPSDHRARARSHLRGRPVVHRGRHLADRYGRCTDGRPTPPGVYLVVHDAPDCPRAAPSSVQDLAGHGRAVSVCGGHRSILLARTKTREEQEPGTRVVWIRRGIPRLGDSTLVDGTAHRNVETPSSRCAPLLPSPGIGRSGVVAMTPQWALGELGLAGLSSYALTRQFGAGLASLRAFGS